MTEVGSVKSCVTRTHEVKAYELSRGHDMRLYIPENKFLNSTGSSNDLHGRNLGHVMLSNMLPGLIAGTGQPAHLPPRVVHCGYARVFRRLLCM
jgi:hypothetical protein